MGVALRVRAVAGVLLAVSMIAATFSCEQKETPLGENLLENPSFEDVEDGIPTHWRLGAYRGLEGQAEVHYGVDSETAIDGQNSWRFRGDIGTRRWYVLTQEVEVQNVTHVMLEGWMQIDQVRHRTGQYSHCNFLLTFFDENHHRFREMRFMDKRTRFRTGSMPWFEEKLMARLPVGTRYVAVSCILACEGTAWFDNVRLSATRPMDWQVQRTKNFVFHSVPERPFPVGSIENEQRIFDGYADRLGIESDIVVRYYLYPDTATIQRALEISNYQYISYEDREIHTINPNENHEIVHFMTDEYGVAPRAILEGTVFWLHGEWRGRSVHAVAAQYLVEGKLPPLKGMIDQDWRTTRVDLEVWLPASGSFVGFLVDLWGPERLIELYKASTGTTSYETFAGAFQTVYGASCEEVERQWRTVLAEFHEKLDTERKQ